MCSVCSVSGQDEQDEQKYIMLTMNVNSCQHSRMIGSKRVRIRKFIPIME